MKQIKFSEKFSQIRATRVNDYEARNELLGNLAQVIDYLKAERFRFHVTNAGRLVLQMLLPGDKIETVYLSKALAKEYGQSKFTVAQILKLNVMQTYYTTANGDENAILTLHKVANQLTAADFTESVEDIKELLTELAKA